MKVIGKVKNCREMISFLCTVISFHEIFAKENDIKIAVFHTAITVEKLRENNFFTKELHSKLISRNFF